MFHCAKNEVQQIGRHCMILHMLQANEDWNSTIVLVDVAVDANPWPVVNRCNFVTGKWNKLGRSNGLQNLCLNLLKHIVSKHPARSITLVPFSKLRYFQKLEHWLYTWVVEHWLLKVKNHPHLLLLPRFFTNNILNSFIDWTHAPACQCSLVFQVPADTCDVPVSFLDAACHVPVSGVISLVPLLCCDLQGEYGRLPYCNWTSCTFNHHDARNLQGLCPPTSRHAG